MTRPRRPLLFLALALALFAVGPPLQVAGCATSSSDPDATNPSGDAPDVTVGDGTTWASTVDTTAPGGDVDPIADVAGDAATNELPSEHRPPEDVPAADSATEDIQSDVTVEDTGLEVPTEDVLADAAPAEDVPPDTAPSPPEVLVDAQPEVSPDEPDPGPPVPDASPPEPEVDAGPPLPECPPSCDDGDPCNGEETCDPTTGACVSEVFPACPLAPPECDQSGGVGGPVGKTPQWADPGGLRLYDEDEWAASHAVIDGVAAHPSVEEVGIEGVLASLNRQAEPVGSLGDAECFANGFEWNSGDVGVSYWYPQGITGSSDATEDGLVAGRRVGIVTWYHKPENDSGASGGSAPDKGARVSVYDITDPGDIDYRLALLVKPKTAADGTPTYGPVTVHAGGLAWYGPYLFVADTTKGFRVFDTTRILKVKTGNKDVIGLVAGDGYYAHGYRFVIPQVSRYRLCGSSCCARFSFVALDRSTSPHSLVAGEYSASSKSGRLHRWPLDASTSSLLETPSGGVTATEVLFHGVENVQGGLTWEGAVYLSASGDHLGLWAGAPGETLVKRSWPYGPEDLYLERDTGHLWSHTEHPGERTVFGSDAADLLVGCD